jgi:hypothetical protein
VIAPPPDPPAGGPRPPAGISAGLLFRRSLRHALQWRLLFLWWASLVVPGAIAALPVFQFLRRELDRSTRAKDAVAYLDGPTLLDLLRQFGEPGASNAVALGLAGGVLTLLFVAPFVAGATTAAARSDEPLPLSRLLAGAGELYGRMLRTFLCGLVPLGIGAGITAGAMKIASHLTERDLTETAADAHLRNAVLVSAAALFLAHLIVDAARAQFAAEPTRRSALAALWSAARLVVRRPLRGLGVGAIGTAAGLGTAALLMALRLRIDQSGVFRIGLAWLLAQMAHVAIGWGRAARIFGLAELARADAAARARAFPLEPPAPLSPARASGT